MKHANNAPTLNSVANTVAARTLAVCFFSTSEPPDKNKESIFGWAAVQDARLRLKLQLLYETMTQRNAKRDIQVVQNYVAPVRMFHVTRRRGKRRETNDPQI